MSLGFPCNWPFSCCVSTLIMKNWIELLNQSRKKKQRKNKENKLFANRDDNDNQNTLYSIRNSWPNGWHCSCVVGVGGLESRSEHRLSWIKFIVVFSIRPGNCCYRRPTSNEVTTASCHTVSSLLFSVMVHNSMLCSLSFWHHWREPSLYETNAK